MFRPAHFDFACELLRLILTSRTPADKRMEHYFRAHREMGSHDRGHVAETVYGCLRNKRVLQTLCGDGNVNTEELTAAYLRMYNGMSAETVLRLDRNNRIRDLMQRLETADIAALPAAVRSNLPDRLWESLLQQFGKHEALQLAEALNRPALVDLRVNTLKTTREQLQAELAGEDYPAQPTPYAPQGLRRADRKPLFSTQAFQSGRFEVQDEGSQLLSLLLEPQPKERVVDFCAGGGGKTLHLGNLMNNTGALYAFDIHGHRLERLKPRVRRAGLSNVRAQLIKNESDPQVKRLRGTIHRVLVDAPCSGTGTLRRNPDIKWREIDLPALITQQRNILAAAATLVKPGGRLMYATCSLLRAENEDIVDAFLLQHPDFTHVPVNDILARLKIPLNMPGLDLRLFPHLHGTDGFYGAVLEKHITNEAQRS